MIRNLADYSSNQIYSAVMTTIDFRNAGSENNVDYPVIAMDYTVSVYHDKRNEIRIL